MKLTKNTIKRLIKEESEEMLPPNRSNVVHIVMYDYGEGYLDIEGVFSTREKAEAYIEEEDQDPRRRAKAHDFEIDAWDVDYT